MAEAWPRQDLSRRASLGRLSPNTVGILAMTVGSACFVVNDSFVKLASEAMPTTQIVALRGVFATALVVGLAYASGALAQAPRMLNAAVVIRGFLELTVAILFITALSRMSLPDITAILQSVPLMVTALSVIFLGLKVGWRRWAAVVAGFVGVLMVVQPNPSNLNEAALLALLSAFGVAARDLVTRRIDPAIPSMLVALVTTAALMLYGFAVGPMTGGWTVPDARGIALLAAAAFLVATGNYLVIVAMRTGDISVISPFRYSIILFALALGYGIWGDLPDALALGGILLIVGSGVYIIHRERVRARAERAEAERPVTTAPPDMP